MPKTTPVVASRVCTADPIAHIVSDSRVLGMISVSRGIVDIYCIDHGPEFDRALQAIGGKRLEM